LPRPTTSEAPSSARDSDRSTARRKLVARLHQHSEDIRRITANLDDAALGRRLNAAQWSVTELVCHVWRVQQLFEDRLDRMLGSEMPAFESYGPDGDPVFEALVASHGASRAVEAFRADRDQLVRRLDALTDAQWRRQGRHPTFATFDIEFLIEYMVHHEAHHVYQMFMRRLSLGRLS
jgi:hypothetical protein